MAWMISRGSESAASFEAGYAVGISRYRKYLSSIGKTSNDGWPSRSRVNKVVPERALPVTKIGSFGEVPGSRTILTSINFTFPVL